MSIKRNYENFYLSTVEAAESNAVVIGKHSLRPYPGRLPSHRTNQKDTSEPSSKQAPTNTDTITGKSGNSSRATNLRNEINVLRHEIAGMKEDLDIQDENFKLKGQLSTLLNVQIEKVKQELQDIKNSRDALLQDIYDLHEMEQSHYQQTNGSPIVKPPIGCVVHVSSLSTSHQHQVYLRYIDENHPPQTFFNQQCLEAAQIISNEKKSLRSNKNWSDQKIEKDLEQRQNKLVSHVEQKLYGAGIHSYCEPVISLNGSVTGWKVFGYWQSSCLTKMRKTVHAQIGYYLSKNNTNR